MEPFNSTGENNNQVVNPPVYLSPYKYHNAITRYFSTPQKSACNPHCGLTTVPRYQKIAAVKINVCRTNEDVSEQ